MMKFINYLMFQLIAKKNIFKRFFFTLIIIFLYVIGTNIPIPCLTKEQQENISPIFGIFSTNSNYPLSLLSLGIIPYITSSIIMQFASKIFSFLKEWEEQGDKGKYKLNLTSRFLTLFLSCGYGIAMVSSSAGWFKLTSQKLSNIVILEVIFFLVVGVFICIWLADLITAKGIGNGVSILIAINISQEVFNTFSFLFNKENPIAFLPKFLILCCFLLLLILTIILCSAYLKIPIFYYTSKSNDAKIDKNIPFKLNTTGVLPVILANSFMSIFNIVSQLSVEDGNFKKFVDRFLLISTRQNLGFSFFLYLSFILLFSVFSIFMVINPHAVSEHLSKQDAYIEGIKPGEDTTFKITSELFKVNLISSVLLTLIAAIPDLVSFCMSRLYNIPMPKLGGTSLLIIVGVALECIQRMNVKTHLPSMYQNLF
ncbi:MAG: preprotein translocase subunit SecY [Vigna little leaf phytoplasma]|nr:preprotein translocase subunit SecY [Vigna little leaf phytoplasma]